MKRKLLAICSIVFLVGTTFGQVTDLGGPLSWKGKVLDNKDVVTQTMPGYDQATIDEEDAVRDAAKDAPWRFGYKYNTNFNLLNAGSWTNLPNGDRVWRLGLECPGAMTINVIFENMYLPDGSSLYLFDEDNTNRVGAYTARNNNTESTLGTELVHGDHIIVEYYEPASVQGQGHLTVANVIHGYRSLNIVQKNLAKALNSSGNCNHDARCAVDPYIGGISAWDDQIRSVAMIVVNGNGICTGALINNSCDDGTPYFLTANHCSGGEANWAFRFNWDVPEGDPGMSCGTTAQTPTSFNNSANYDQSANGATVLVQGTQADHELLLITGMNATDAQNWGLFYAGWDHSDNENAVTEVTGIHHPAGDIKKICRADDTGNGIFHANNAGAATWEIDSWEVGVTEPGSSGSPLFDQNGRIIGQLYGGAAACSGTNNNGALDYYGRLGVSWGLGIGGYLDPAACAPNTTNDGYDPNAPALADDAGVNGIISPNGNLCTTSFTPEVTLRNNGTNTLTSVTINYDVDGGTNQTFNWTGSLASSASVNVTLPAMTTTLGAHVFNSSTSMPNGVADNNTANDASLSNFSVGDEDVQIDINTDCWGSETTWTVEDASSNVIASGGPYTDVTGGTLETANVCLVGGQCYDFTINDTYGDGMYGSQYGSCTVDGDYTVTQTSNATVLATIQAANSDFGNQEVNNFCVTSGVSAPVSNFTGAPTSICVGQSVTFQDLTTNTPTSWSWNFGDGGTSTQQNPTHVFNTAGTYTIQLTATNGGGSDTYTETNYITVNGLPNVNASGGTSICSGSSATLTASGANSYAWNNGAGSGSSVTVSPGSTTTYTVTGTDANGCVNTDNVTVTVNALPTVSASGGTSVCAGGSATLTASGANSYAWNNGAGSGSSVTVSPGSTTTYTVTGTDANGCTDTDNVTVTVNANPTVNASGTAAICDGASTTLTASGANSYAWNNGAGSGSSVSVSPSSTTTYTVTGTDSNGCTDTDVVTVTVNANPTITAGTVNDPAACATATGSIQVNGSGTGNVSWTGTATGNANGVSMPYTIGSLTAGTYNITYVDGNGCTSNLLFQALTDPSAPAAPTISASGTTTICDGDNVVLTSSYGSGNSWNTAETTSSITVTTSGVYSVTYTDGSGCSSSSSPVTVTVNPNPTVTAAGATSICEGSSATISASGANTYSWDNGAGSGASVTVTPTGTTTYTVTGTDGNGCSGTDMVTVTVNTAPTVTAGGATSICEGTSGTLTASGASTYAWDNGAGTGASVTVSPTTTTTYTVTGTDANGCTGTDMVTVTVNALPTVSITPATLDTLCANSGDPVTLTGTPSGGTFSGTGISGTTFDPSVAGVGNHTITYDYTDGNGCSNSATIPVVVEMCSSIGENALDGVSLYPNPNNGQFSIAGLPIGTAYEIHDTRGRIVAKGTVENGTEQLEILDVDSGVYYFNAVVNGEAGSIEFIVTK